MNNVLLLLNREVYYSPEFHRFLFVEEYRHRHFLYFRIFLSLTLSALLQHAQNVSFDFWCVNGFYHITELSSLS